MIGPGTGVAPFRGFMEEREAVGASGRNWLFFGEQSRQWGFYYEEEFADWQRRGLLRLDLAFSRDQPEKIYVQHRMREAARDFYAWLEEGAEVFICGDKARMATDVQQEIARIVETEGGRTPEQAADNVAALKKSRRLKLDVYLRSLSLFDSKSRRRLTGSKLEGDSRQGGAQAFRYCGVIVVANERVWPVAVAKSCTVSRPDYRWQRLRDRRTKHRRRAGSANAAKPSPTRIPASGSACEQPQSPAPGDGSQRRHHSTKLWRGQPAHNGGEHEALGAESAAASSSLRMAGVRPGWQRRSTSANGKRRDTPRPRRARPSALQE